MGKLNKKMLKGSYLSTFKEIENELTRCNLNIIFKKQIKEDIFDILLSAQADDVEVEKIVGTDIGVFCSEIVETYVSTMTIGKKLLNYLFLILLNFTAFAIIDLLLYGETGTWALELTAVSLMSDILANHIHNKYKDLITRRFSYITSRWGIFFTLILVANILRDIFQIELSTLSDVNSVTLIGAAASLLLICYLIMKKVFGEQVLN